MERRESIVEMTTAEQLINMCRVVRDELEDLNVMLKNYYSERSEVETRGLYEKMRNTKNRGEQLKTLIMEYLIRSTEIVPYSSTYINLVEMLDRIIQQVDAVAYRILLARENKVMFDRTFIDTFVKIVELEKKQLDAIENALPKIRLSPKKVFEELNAVFIIEEDIDTIFRKSLFEIYNRYSGYITALLILKDIFEHLEDISDFLKSIGEEVRYLALVKSAM
ncbi:MAG: DUF47 family protein [Desulfurococcaceae archaeon]